MEKKNEENVKEILQTNILIEYFFYCLIIIIRF